jgi:hypothetical protein
MSVTRTTPRAWWPDIGRQSYQLGTIVSRQVDNIDETMFAFHLVIWEPYFRDETNEFRPLWVENTLRAGGGQPLIPSYWQDVVRLPWYPIKQVPLEITQKLLNNPSFNPSKKDLAINFMKSGIDCMKQPKGYRQTVRHVFQLDINERAKNMINFNVVSQRDIIVEITRTEGYDDVDYIYTT